MILIKIRIKIFIYNYNYIQKYLKYKTKYIMLKDFNQVGNGKKINKKTCACNCKECKKL